MDDSLSFAAFVDGAQKAAHRAMEDHGRGDYDEFALHAGVAVEKLAKGVLVQKNPLYIVDMRGGAEMLFHLGGHRLARKVRTIGATETLARLRMLDVSLPGAQLDLLIDMRNGVAHSVASSQAKSLLPTFAETVTALANEAAEDIERFWGRWADTARTAVDGKSSQVERDVMIRIRQARHRFDDRFAGLPEGAKEQVLSARRIPEQFTITTLPDSPMAVLRYTPVCPACGGQASTVYTLSTSTSTTTTMNATAFACQLCGLELDDLEEIRAADPGTETWPLQVCLSHSSLFPAETVTLGEARAG
ncbi:hypothetical protein [Streptomyces sp. TLI_171]|uniref:hypothetical protein n=1 Tax=Streptomyces sp. TLI_171 TaxID=1938859 RepID=UPI000C19C029|nr:hypothetical protein [Streptomyces sp. TLI_171]RKE20112.1 hypothetical protein BX266_3457 [Streptomyces sp. TLI_171]